MFVSRDVTFFENEPYFAASHLQGETFNEDETLNTLLIIPHDPTTTITNKSNNQGAMIIPNLETVSPVQQEISRILPNNNTTNEVQSSEVQPPDQGKHKKQVPKIQVYSRRNRSPETDTTVPIASPTEDCSETEVSPPSPSIYLPIAVRKGTRSCTQHPISRFVSYENLSKSYKTFVTNVDSVKTPKNIEEALESAEWRQAGKKTVGCKWIFTTKFKPDGRID
ncbi:hypothetical protein V6Z11_A02G067900 [Gossypium hirsutum]